MFSIKKRLQRLWRDTGRSSVLTLAIVLLVALPVVAIAYKLFFGPGGSWQGIARNLLPEYLFNTAWLLAACSAITLVLGISTAWLTARHEFPFRKQLEWLLILPLAIPAYITAYTYAGIFDYGGSLELLLRFFGLEGGRINIMNSAGLAFVLGISLFPYVYVSARVFFMKEANSLLEASQTLGAGETRTFFRLALPLARPAVVAGLMLALMETLNDYGAAAYYGVNTFTTGIFYTWFSLDDFDSAVYLSALLLFIVFGLILLEKWQRRKKRFGPDKQASAGYISRKKHGKVKQSIITATVFLPVALGFAIPVAQLLYWASMTFGTVFDPGFWMLALQSFGIALLAAIVVVFVATLLVVAARWNRIVFLKNLSKLTVLGYAIPGAVVAMGVMVVTLGIGWWVYGTLAALLYAYMVRFMAVAYNPIESVSLKVGQTVSDASKTLGANAIKTFFRIKLPLLKAGILGAGTLVFVDVLKELPLTLLLKPYHLNTLAVKAFEYASDEMVKHAALPSLFIILTAAVPVYFLNRLITR